MPLCSLDELRAMNPQLEPNVSQFLFNIFGGSARNYNRQRPGFVTNIALVKESMLWFFGEEEKRAQQDNWKSAFLIICQQIVKPAEAQKTVFNSMMRHRHVDGKSIWASMFMEILASKICEKRENAMFHAMKKIIGVGNLFESIVHAKLTTSTTGLGLQRVSFYLKPLHKKGMRGLSRNLVSFMFPTHVTLLRNVKDINLLLEEERYGLPVTSDSFLLVDAMIVRSDMLLQMTVSKERHKGAVSRLQAIRDSLLEKNPLNHMMVFVVPKDNIKSFKYQEGLGDIPQFVMSPDPVLDTMQQKKKRKSNP